MGRRGEDSEEEDLDDTDEDEDDMDFDEDEDEDFEYEEEDSDGEVEGRRARGPDRSPARKVTARRLIEQAREQRELHKSLAEFDEYVK